MAERDGGGGAPDADLSHDPRTWLRLKPEAEAEAAPAAAEPAAPSSAPSDSFDPSTWAKPATAFRPKPEAEAAPPKEKKPKKARGAAAEEAPPADPAPAAAEGASESFDPSTWAKPTTAFRPLPGAPAEPEGAAGPAPAVAAAKGAPPKGLLIGGAAALVLAIGAGAAWFLTRPGSDPQEAAPAAQAAAGPEVPTVIPAGAERSVMTLAGSSGLLGALTAQGVAPAQAQAAADAAVKALGASTGELRVDVSLMRSGSTVTLAALQIRRSDGSGADVVPAGQGFAGKTVAVNMRSEIKVARGQMDAESFWTSAVAAGVNDALIPEFASAFAFDFDFQREIRPGDVFEAAWEQTVNDRGEASGAKRLLYASLTTAEKSKALYRYTPSGQEPGWFDGAGRSIRRSLMRTPVEGARISSQFGYRTHPILGYTKLHKGTDFAAPTGTPIYAAGDGVIQVAAPRGAAGNFISLLHDNGWRTTYMHLNTFAPVSAAGARVTQGTEIGQVGTTGRSTGPHLHFEIYIDNEPVDSMTIQVEQGRALDGDAMKGFAKERDRIDAMRAASF